MKPLREISPGRRHALGLLFFILFFAVWAVATLGGFVPKTFLADPIMMVKSGWVLLTEQGFAVDIGFHHFVKFADRGAHVIDLLGPDHHGHMGRLRASMRALGHPDRFLPTDLGVRNALVRLGHAPDQRDAAWSPWRSYALMHLWNTLMPPHHRTEN